MEGGGSAQTLRATTISVALAYCRKGAGMQRQASVHVGSEIPALVEIQH